MHYTNTQSKPARMPRRCFLQTLALASAACAAAGMGGCQKKPADTPETWYANHHDDIVKENKGTFNYVLPLLEEAIGKDEAAKVYTATLARLDQLIPGLPYIGGSANDLTMNLYNSAAALAFYQEMQLRGIKPEETGRILFQAVYKQISSDPSAGLMGRMANSALAQDKIKKEAAASQKRTYAEDWVFDFVPGDGTFDFGVDYTECGIVKYFKAQGAEEFAPYMCLLDAPISRAMNTGLVRTQTLARGDSRCDFRYKTGREVSVEWDPGYVKGGK